MLPSYITAVTHDLLRVNCYKGLKEKVEEITAKTAQG